MSWSEWIAYLYVVVGMVIGAAIYVGGTLLVVCVWRPWRAWSIRERDRRNYAYYLRGMGVDGQEVTMPDERRVAVNVERFINWKKKP